MCAARNACGDRVGKGPVSAGRAWCGKVTSQGPHNALSCRGLSPSDLGEVLTQQRVVDVPQVQTVQRMVPRVEVQVVDRQVPRVEIQTVDRQVEVPQIQIVDKVVEVPPPGGFKLFELF